MRVSGFTEKRKEDRAPARGQLHGEVMVYQPMTIVDVSHDGAQIETPFPLQLDSLHQFRVTLGDLSVVLRGRVVHCRVFELRGPVAMYRTGLEFVEPSAHVRNAITSFVSILRVSGGSA